MEINNETCSIKDQTFYQDFQRGRTTVGITTATKTKLDKNRAPGQCYDGFIRQLVELWERTDGNGK